MVRRDGIVREMLGLPVYLAYRVTDAASNVALDILFRIAPGWVGSIVQGVIDRLVEDGMAEDAATEFVFGKPPEKEGEP